jgi:hypothetical protein
MLRASYGPPEFASIEWDELRKITGSDVRSDHHFTKRSGDMVYTSVLD